MNIFEMAATAKKREAPEDFEEKPVYKKRILGEEDLKYHAMTSRFYENLYKALEKKTSNHGDEIKKLEHSRDIEINKRLQITTDLTDKLDKEKASRWISNWNFMRMEANFNDLKSRVAYLDLPREVSTYPLLSRKHEIFD